MLNGEKFEKEIERVGFDFAITKNKEIISCDNCNNCIFDGAKPTCTHAKIRWLLEEYKDPILNEEEKKILNKLIEVNREIVNTDILFVEKLDSTNTHCKCFLYLMFENRNSCETITFDSDLIFTRMKSNKQYSLKDLGLC